jgi:hypothetical protein
MSNQLISGEFKSLHSHYLKLLGLFLLKRKAAAVCESQQFLPETGIIATQASGRAVGRVHSVWEKFERVSSK